VVCGLACCLPGQSPRTCRENSAKTEDQLPEQHAGCTQPLGIRPYSGKLWTGLRSILLEPLVAYYLVREQKFTILNAGIFATLSALLALSVAGAALGFSTPSLWVALVEATPKRFTGTMGGIQNFGGNLAGIVVAVLTGYILEVTKTFFFALMAGSIAVLIGAVSTWFLIKQQTD
jgi:nitrate/nitrite transporter NarK